MHCLSLDSIYCHPAPVALLCIHYKCAGFLHRCCNESNMSASPGVGLLWDRFLAEVSLPGLSHVMLVVWIYFGRYSGQAVAGFPLGLHPASLHPGCLGAMKQGFYIQLFFLQILCRNYGPLCLWVIYVLICRNWKHFVNIGIKVWRFNLYHIASIRVLVGVDELLLYFCQFVVNGIYMGTQFCGVCLLEI